MIGILLLIPGVLFLMKGADFFVESSAALAKRMKISQVVIGLTVVAFGTSLPELVVNMVSAVNGNTAIALGNVVGSNIANILLILGISATITPLVVKHNTVWKEIPMSFLAAILLLLFALQQKIDTSRIWEIIGKDGNTVVGSLNMSHGIFLLFIFVIFLYYTFGIAKDTDAVSPDVRDMSLKKSGIYLVLGLLAVVAGGKMTVDGALAIARSFGVSEALLGLTVVAVGTSLPELVTNVMAARKGFTDIAIGNVIGSNIFNIFFIMATTAVLRPIPVNISDVINIVFLLFVTLLTFIFLFVLDKYKVGKIEGVIMLSLYVAYVIYLFLQYR